MQLLAGTGKTEIKSGIATEASFSAPNGIGIDTQIGELYVNNVNGQWMSRQATTIELSKIKLLTLSHLVSHYLDKNDLEGAKQAFWDYHNDPFHINENVGPPIGSLGWQYMSKRNIQAAIVLFSLINEAYPERWKPYYYLGDVYKIIGQLDKAKVYYEKALEKDNSNPLIIGKLKALKDRINTN